MVGYVIYDVGWAETVSGSSRTLESECNIAWQAGGGDGWEWEKMTVVLHVCFSHITYHLISMKWCLSYSAYQLGLR